MSECKSIAWLLLMVQMCPYEEGSDGELARALLGVLHVTADSFLGVAALTMLHLCRHGELQLAPRCFRHLSMLAELSIRSCGLKAVPEAVLSGKGGTLWRLDLSHIYLGLSLPPECFNVLEELKLVECGLRVFPAALSGVVGTLQRLDLSCNCNQAIDKAASDILVAMPRLRWMCISGQSGYQDNDNK